MRRILVANRKGGCGKTMVAITLAAALAATGARVGLADADRQKSALRWLRRRPAAAAPIAALDWTEEADAEAARGLDWLVIDAPGALRGRRASELLGAADVLVTPALPAVFDAESSRRFLGDIEEVKRVRKGRVTVLAVANRVRGGARAAAAVARHFAAIGAEPVAVIGERGAYPDLAAQGLSIFDSRRKAHVALRAEWQPLLDRLRA